MNNDVLEGRVCARHVAARGVDRSRRVDTRNSRDRLRRVRRLPYALNVWPHAGDRSVPVVVLLSRARERDREDCIRERR